MPEQIPVWSCNFDDIYYNGKRVAQVVVGGSHREIYDAAETIVRALNESAVVLKREGY